MAANQRPLYIEGIPGGALRGPRTTFMSWFGCHDIILRVGKILFEQHEYSRMSRSYSMRLSGLLGGVGMIQGGFHDLSALNLHL